MNIPRLWLTLPLLALLAGCVSKTEDHQTVIARFFIEAKEGEAANGLVLPQSGVQIAVNPKPVIAEFDLVNAEVAQVELGKCLLFQLTPAATRDLYRLTATNQGRRLVLVLNDEVIGARRIERPFADGTIAVFAEMPDDALPALVDNLKKTSAKIQKDIARKR